MSLPVAPTSQDRLMRSFRALVREEFPNFNYLGVFEYSIQDTDGSVVSCSPTDTNLPLPPLTSVPLQVNSLGTVKPEVGAKCLVSFINGDPARPFILASSPDPVDVKFSAGEVSVATGNFSAEHVCTTEATLNLIINTLFLILRAGNPSTWTNTGKLFDPATFPANLITELSTMLTGAGTPIPPVVPTGGGLIDPATLATLQGILATKVPDPLGNAPNIGCPNFKAG